MSEPEPEPDLSLPPSLLFLAGIDRSKSDPNFEFPTSQWLYLRLNSISLQNWRKGSRGLKDSLISVILESPSALVVLIPQKGGRISRGGFLHVLNKGFYEIPDIS